MFKKTIAGIAFLAASVLSVNAQENKEEKNMSVFPLPVPMFCAATNDVIAQIKKEGNWTLNMIGNDDRSPLDAIMIFSKKDGTVMILYGHNEMDITCIVSITTRPVFNEWKVETGLKI